MMVEAYLVKDRGTGQYDIVTKERHLDSVSWYLPGTDEWFTEREIDGWFEKSLILTVDEDGVHYVD